MNVSSNIFLQLISIVLGISGLIAIIDYAGLLPPSIAKWVARNRLEAALRALKRIGVRICWDEDQPSLSVMERALTAVGVREPVYKVQLRQMLVEDTFEGEIDVGQTRTFSSQKFIDVMGGSVDVARSISYARILKTHAAVESLGGYDFVATPKGGTPILGYEFARLVDKPLVLGRDTEKAKDPTGLMGQHLYLDFPKAMLLNGKKALLVDDSTTGGRKLLALADRLTEAGSLVSDALVLFEPKGKGARELLESKGIRLHTILVGPQGRF